MITACGATLLQQDAARAAGDATDDVGGFAVATEKMADRIHEVGADDHDAATYAGWERDLERRCLAFTVGAYSLL